MAGGAVGACRSTAQIATHPSALLPAGHVAAQAAANGSQPLQQPPSLARGLFVRLKYGEYQLALVRGLVPPPAPGGKSQVSVQLPLDAAPGSDLPLERTVPLSGVSGADPLSDEQWETAGRAELQRLRAYRQQRGLVLPLADAAAAAWRKRTALVWHSLHGGKPLQEQQAQVPALLQQLQDASGPAQMQQWLAAAPLPPGAAAASQQQQQQDQQDRQQTEQVGVSIPPNVASPLPDGVHPARGPSSDGQQQPSARHGSQQVRSGSCRDEPARSDRTAPSRAARRQPQARSLPADSRSRSSTRSRSPKRFRSRSRDRRRPRSSSRGRARSRTHSRGKARGRSRGRRGRSSSRRGRSRSRRGRSRSRRGRSRSRSRSSPRRPEGRRQRSRGAHRSVDPEAPLAPVLVPHYPAHSAADARPASRRWEVTTRKVRCWVLGGRAARP